MNNLLLAAFGRGLRPAVKTGIVEWSARNVRLARSSRSEKADLTLTPWLIAPLEAILGHEHSEVVILAPVGSGKSTLLEIASAFIVAEKPGPTLIGLLTNPDAQAWGETGLVPALRGCSLIDPLWPKTKNHIRKDQILFPHMPLWWAGSNLSNFQAKSCDNVFLDEAWQVQKTLIEEARKRTHDRFGSKVVLLSQAGTTGDDLDTAFRQCFTHTFAYLCPQCGQHHPYEWGNLKFTRKKDEAGQTIWDSLEVHYLCPCGHQFKDTSQDRRAMAEGGKYLPVHSDNPLRGHVAYHYTALSVWWIPWHKLAVEFIKANEQKRKGNFDPLRQFLQKRLAKPWDDLLLLDSQKPLNLGSYTLAEAKPWDITILTADVQQDELWYVVRTWTRAGESQLLEYGKVITFGDLEKVREKWSIKPKAVFLDAAYRTEEVKGALARYKWIGLNGRPEQFFTVKNKNTTSKRIYSDPKVFRSTVGTAYIYYYSSIGVKDVLFILKSGGGTRWEIPSDASEQYLNALQSEIKVSEGGKVFYKQVKEKNHWLDCETMQITAAMLLWCYPTIAVTDN